jgi:hypothetical protein
LLSGLSVYDAFSTDTQFEKCRNRGIFHYFGFSTDTQFEQDAEIAEIFYYRGFSTDTQFESENRSNFSLLWLHRRYPV